MPDALPFFCRQPGCQTRVHTGYCPEHLPRRNHRVYDDRRGSAAVRGYDHAWQRFRRRRLMEDPMCADCYERSTITPSTELHHIVKVRDAPHLRLVDSNTRALCKSCHSTRTARGE